MRGLVPFVAFVNFQEAITGLDPSFEFLLYPEQ